VTRPPRAARRSRALPEVERSEVDNRCARQSDLECDLGRQRRGDEQDGGTAKATANSGIASAEAIGDHPGGSTGNDHTNATATASKSGEAFARSVLQGSAIAKSDSGGSNAQDSGGGVAKSTTFRNGTSQAFTRDDCFALAVPPTLTARRMQIAMLHSPSRKPLRIKQASPLPQRTQTARSKQSRREQFGGDRELQPKATAS